MLEANSWWRQVRHRRGSEATPRQALRRVRLLRPALLVPVTAGVALALLASALLWGAPAAQAQSGLATPANFQAVNGPNAGEAILSWDAVAGADFYRVGWVAEDAVLQAFAAKSDALNHYVFADITSATSYTATGLQPGKKYWFTVASLSERFGESGRADVLSLTLNNDGSSCPSPTPGPGSTVTPTPAPQVTGGDYDADNDGLIEIRNLAQLDAMRYDLDGDNRFISNDDAYAAAFPNPAIDMGCPADGCLGFELVANLNFDTNSNGRFDAGDAYWNDGAGWLPIGGSFTADFDGNGHTISNLHINRSESGNVGLFASMGTGGTIQNLGLVAVDVTGTSYVGGLTGSDSGSITASYTTGRVYGTGIRVGGLVGNKWAGSISESYSTARTTGNSSSVGGLLGGNYGYLTDVYATGRVVSYGSEAGGLVGFNYGSVTAGYATGEVTGSVAHVGGLVGSNSGGTITGSYATGKVIGTSNTGGLAGYNNGVITATYASGDVTGTSGVGGLVGAGGTITNSYAIGTVSATGTVGGLVATSSSVNASYWNSETTGQSESAGGAGKTTQDLRSPTAAQGIYATWDPDFWDFGTSEQYPVLKVGGLSVALQRGEAAQTSNGATPASADRAALVALYNAAGGPNWTNNDGWNTSAPIGQWHGVTTDSDGRVTRLELDTNGLNGRIPADLGGLSQLTTLRMGDNQLSGPIPAALGDLSNLSILGLGNNRLSGSIPPELGRLSSLTRASLWNNQLSGPIPPQLGNLSRLTKISLGENQLTGPIPSELGNLSSLEQLALHNNQLSGAIPSELGNLSDLTWLDFDFNRLSGSIPRELGNLANLTTLRMGSNQLNGLIPAELGNLSNLSVLGLGNNRLFGSIPPELGSMSSLTRVSMWNNQLTGPIPAELGSLSRLTKLSLGRNQLTGAIPSELGDLANLKELVLQNNRLSGAIPSALGDLGNLTHLMLSGNQLTGAIPSELGSPIRLTRLYLHGNGLSGPMPAELGKLSNLDVLNLSHNQLTGAIPSELGAPGGAVRTYQYYDRAPGVAATAAGGAFKPMEIAHVETGRWSKAKQPAQSGNLIALRVLNLSHNRLSQAIPETLGSLSGLQRLYLNSNQLAGPAPAAVGRLDLQAWRVDSENEVNECGHDSTNRGIQNDRETLQYLFSVTDGRGFFDGSRGNPNWAEYEGWEETFEGDNSIPLEDWFGVTVNQHGRVTKLELPDNGLEGDTANWHENLAELKGAASSAASPLYCLETLDLSENSLGGDIGAVLSTLETDGDVTLNFSGNGFKNWVPQHEDDPDEVIMESGNGLLADAIETMTSDEVALVEVAEVGLKILRYTARSPVARLIGKFGGRVSMLDTVLGNEAVMDALITAIFEGTEASCKNLLSAVRGGDRYCETGIFSDPDDIIGWFENNCSANACNLGCPKENDLGCIEWRKGQT